MNSSVRVLFITYGGSGTCRTVSLEVNVTLVVLCVLGLFLCWIFCSLAVFQRTPTVDRGALDCWEQYISSRGWTAGW